MVQLLVESVEIVARETAEEQRLPPYRLDEVEIGPWAARLVFGMDSAGLAQRIAQVGDVGIVEQLGGEIDLLGAFDLDRWHVRRRDRGRARADANNRSERK